MITQIERDRLYQAFGNFIEAIRPYIVSILLKQEGDKWAAKFAESLSFDQKEQWNTALRNGSKPEVLIDYHHLKSFAIKNKELLKPDFGKKFGDLPNWMGEIAEVRHKVAHFQDVDEDEAMKAWIHMRTIAKILKMDELEAELTRTEKGKEAEAAPKPTVTGTLPPWFQVIQPHFDIKNGQLDESVFAANLAEVSNGTGREVYKSAEMFFSKTYFTAGIRDIAKRVVSGLNGGQDSQNRVISLQTGFGGGKTHTLISLYHIAKSGKKLVGNPKLNELFLQTGNPTFDFVNVAVFTNTTNDPVQGRVLNGTQLNTIWGDLAFQLGGERAYEIVKANDVQRANPKGLFKKVLEQCKPCLILIDELADYCVSAAAVTVGASSLKDQTISFMQELTEAVAGTDNCVLIATLPISAQEVAASPEAQQILNALENRIVRVGANLKPVEDDEIFEVVRRRLFEEDADWKAADKIVDAYSGMYQSLMAEVPSYALKSDYRERMRKSYPFHPELIDVFRLKWASTPNFQRTRGILRILASIVSDLWKRRQSLVGSNSMIHTSDINFGNVDALTSQITMLYGANWDSVISADISGSSSNAYRIDSVECIKGGWGVRELKRQINSLYYERSGMSKSPAKLSAMVAEKAVADHPATIIKSVYTFEFLGLKAKDVVEENDLETALLDHLQEFMLEMGNGFCFEARQKKILIGNEYFFVDIVFYHRILKCHVLVELKVEEFNHNNIGQLNTYVNYYKTVVKQPDDNPPVGILLVTDKNSALVEFATAGIDNQLFVSKYLVELPAKENLQAFIQNEINNWK
jgi:hypothetical protein